MTRALEWVICKAKSSRQFRARRVNPREELGEVAATIKEPQNLAQALRFELTEQAWRQLNLSLRQHQHTPDPPWPRFPEAGFRRTPDPWVGPSPIARALPYSDAYQLPLRH